MILADTSVWINHFSGRESRLGILLADGMIVTHPAVIGELTTGSLPRRSQTIHDLLTLPRIEEAGFEETLHFLEKQKLSGKGLGWSDVQLLAACRLSNTRLWTADKRLYTEAKRLKLNVAV